MEIKEVVNNLEKVLEENPNARGLKKAIDIIENFEKPIKYENSNFYFAAFFSFLAIVVLLYNDISNLLLYIILIIIFIITIFIPLKRNSNLNSIANKMHYIDLLNDNKIRPGRKSWKYFDDRYYGFSKGNYSNKIEDIFVDEDYQGKEYSFDSLLFTYHYVNKRVVTYRCGKNNEKICKKVKYDHFYRYGVEIPFETLRSNIAILDDNFSVNLDFEYQTSSIKFNKIYKAYGDDEIELGKFLKPAIIIEFEDLEKSFNNLSFQFFNKRLCIMFSDDNVMPQTLKRVYGLDEPKQFLKELNGHTSLKKLNLLYDFSEHLLRHSDSNFS